MNAWTSYALTVMHAVRRRGSYALTIALCSVSLLSTSPVNAGNQSRPMGGTCNTTFVFTGVGAIHLDGTCHLLHLGLTAVVATQIAIPQSDGTLLITNVATYTAANGDELFASFVGTGSFTQTGIAFSGTETYNGGTGQFADASGSSALVGTAQFTSATAGVGAFTGQGSISY
jgi:hypothetical protein